MALLNTGPSTNVGMSNTGAGENQFSVNNRRTQVTAGVATNTPAEWGGVIANVRQYKFRGYNPVTQQYEYWLSTVAPSGPPSGNSLNDIVICDVLYANSGQTTK